MAAPALTSYSTSITNKDTSRPALYTFSFTPGITIQAGEITTNVSAIYGKLTFEFPTKLADGSLLWPLDLGTGLASGAEIPCSSGGSLLPITTGGEITCYIYTAASASTANNVRIEVINFKEISSNPGLHH